MKNTILIVDDSAPFRYILSAMLNEETDMQVVGEAKDGLEALTKTKELSPDLVLLDIRMPEIDGLEVARRLKAEYPHIKIVFITAYDFAEYSQAAKECGADGFILKYSPVEEIIPAIRTLFSEE